MKIHSIVARKEGKRRIGKGFSKSELKEAGIDFKQALRLTIPVDLRRRTKHEENIKVLKQQLGLQAPKISKPPEPSKKPPKKPAKLVKEVKEKKPPEQAKAAEVSKPSKRAKAPKVSKTEKPTPKKAPPKRKAVKSKGEEKT